MELAVPALQGIIVLMVVGFLMIAAEVFVPGMILGLLGALCLLAGIGWSYAEYGLVTGTLMLAGTGIVGTLAFLGWMAAFPKTFVGRQVINRNAVARPSNTEREALLGAAGEAITPLRPSGTARLNGRRVDVVAEAGFIEQGAPIHVVLVEGNRVVVRPS